MYLISVNKEPFERSKKYDFMLNKCISAYMQYKAKYEKLNILIFLLTLLDKTNKHMLITQ